jgi:predicted nucleic acid-binding protein
MKTVGIDTCILLRLVVGEPIAQAEKARAFIENSFNHGVNICVCDLTVAEAYHALVHHYEVPKAKTVRVLKAFLESPMITSTGHALSVLGEYKGTGAGFVDRLIRMELLDHAHEIATFDRSFARLENVSII